MSEAKMYKTLTKSASIYVILSVFVGVLLTGTDKKIQMELFKEAEEVLPFIAVDQNGKAVTDLTKSEIILLVDGRNFRGFSLVSPADDAIAALTVFLKRVPGYGQAPKNSGYAIVFPYMSEFGRTPYLQLGIARTGAVLTVPEVLVKRKPVARIEEVKEEINALELLKNNIWQHSQLVSLNLKPLVDRKKGVYSIGLPQAFERDDIEIYKMDKTPGNEDIRIRRQVVPWSARLEVPRGEEDYVLVINPNRQAALVITNKGGNDGEITDSEAKRISRAIGERKKQQQALEKENIRIPVELIEPGQHRSSIEKTGQKLKETELQRSPANAETTFMVPDYRIPLLQNLETLRSNLIGTANKMFAEDALKYLRQKRIKKALHYLYKILERKGEENVPLKMLIGKLSRLDRETLAIEKQSEELLGNDKSRTFQKIVVRAADLQPEKFSRIFQAMKVILNNNLTRIDTVLYELKRLPNVLIPGESEIKKTALKVEHKTPDLNADTYRNLSGSRLERCGNLLEQFSGALREMEIGTFVQAGRLRKIYVNFRQTLARCKKQIDFIQSQLIEMRHLSPDDVGNFVIRESDLFPLRFKKSFYRNKLEKIGIEKNLLEESVFFGVIVRSHGFLKNKSGHWEATFPYRLTLIYIPGGIFTMGVPWESGGAEDESPQHEVTLKGYWISKYEITFHQFDQYCKSVGKKQVSDFERGRNNRPVSGVSWEESMAFCRWLSLKTDLNFRLPTEAQWEKAARGTDKRMYPWGNNEPDAQSGDLTNLADIRFYKKYRELNPPLDEKERKRNEEWIAKAVDDGYIYAAPVGSYPGGASPYGVMDMAGNLWEWVMDWYDDDYYQRSPKENPIKTSRTLYRVARGGGWDCHPWLLRTTGRAGCDPQQGNDTLGFRIVAY
jgi:formylglycine-generating enzyme required for sulfatase activity